MTYKLRTACMDIYNAGTLKVSKNISAAFSRFLLGLSGASVSNTGCCKTTRIGINKINRRKTKRIVIKVVLTWLGTEKYKTVVT